MNKLSDADIKAILPSSISQDEKAQEIADAVSKSIRSDNKRIPQIAIYAEIENASNGILALLAWQFHADNYEDSLAAIEKRNMIKEAICYHRYKGTIYAMDNAVRPLLPQVEVKEWFDYAGKPYHFKIVTRSRLKSAEHIKQLQRTVEDAKNVRSWLECIECRCAPNQTIHMGIKRVIKRNIHIYQADDKAETVESSNYLGVALMEEETVEIGG